MLQESLKYINNTSQVLEILLSVNVHSNHGTHKRNVLIWSIFDEM